MPTHSAHYALRPHRPSNTPSCPAPHLPIRDPSSSKGSRTWHLRPQSGPTNSCLLHWLSSLSPQPLVSLPECPRLLPPGMPPLAPSLYTPPPNPLLSSITLPACNDPTIGSYNNYHLSPNGVPRGSQRWYGLVYLVYKNAGSPKRQGLGNNRIALGILLDRVTFRESIHLKSRELWECYTNLRDDL